jgi:hypothetical protein
MGFDLIGKRIDNSHTSDAGFVFPVSIIINGVGYDSLDDYLESKGLPKNSIKFSCSNRNWHTIWQYVQYANELVNEEFKFNHLVFSCGLLSLFESTYHKPYK